MIFPYEILALKKDKKDKKIMEDIEKFLFQKQDFDLERVSQMALSDKDLLQKLILGLENKKEIYRYNCEKTLCKISEENPSTLYPNWENFVSLLDSKNSYHRCCGLNLLANLSRTDPENKFDPLFDKYFGLLNDPKFIPAVFVARNAGRIMKNKPHLQKRIIQILLAVDQTKRDPERIDLLKADVIQSFEEIFDTSKQKKKILAFVEKQVDCASPKTQKVAKEFLSKYKATEVGK